MTVRFKGFEFPTEPRTMTYLDLPGSASPQVANRWQRVTGQTDNNKNAISIDFFWRGTCHSCGRGIWSSPQDDIINIDNFVTQGMQADVIAEDGVELRACVQCVGSYRSQIIANAAASTDTNKGLIVWPEEVVGPMERDRENRKAALRRWLEPRATAPAVGAYVLHNDRMLRFSSFTADGKVAVMEPSIDPLPMGEVQVLTPCVHGIDHPDVVVLPHFTASVGGAAGTHYVVKRWSGVNVTIRDLKGGLTKTVSANAIAVPAPCVNPAAESAEDKAARLEWALERVKEGLHHRMVAEGVARDWCSTFDPILDSAGLPPRKEQAFYMLTMRVATDAVYDEAQMEKFLDTGWTGTFSARSMTCIDIQREIKPSVAMLSL
jgi:hypothetical protein